MTEPRSHSHGVNFVQKHLNCKILLLLVLTPVEIKYILCETDNYFHDQKVFKEIKRHCWYLKKIIY